MIGSIRSAQQDEAGLLYAGRQKYLVPENKNNLEPPTLFKTRQQAAKKAIITIANANPNSSPTDLHFKLGIHRNKTSENAAHRSSRHTRHQNQHNQAEDTIIIDKYSSISRKDWKERTQAGVKIWINRNTGEVSTECPYIRSSKYVLAQKQKELDEEMKDEGYGTGCLVYDNSELEEVFSMLETESSKSVSSSRPNTATNTATNAGSLSSNEYAITGIDVKQHYSEHKQEHEQERKDNNRRSSGSGGKKRDEGGTDGSRRK